MSARHVIAVRPRSDHGGSSTLCACGAVALPYAPEQRLGHAVHGALVCYHASAPSPENCRECGAPHNNANPPAHGLCPMCAAGTQEDR